MRQRALIIDDDSSFLKAFVHVLRREKIETHGALSPTEALQIYQQFKMDFDVLLIDYRFEGSDVTGAELALRIRKLNPTQIIIFMTGFTDLEPVDEMLKTGASRTFIRKGDDVSVLVGPVLQVLKQLRRPDAEVDTIEDELERTSKINALGLVGRSKSLYELVSQVERLRKFQSRFLIIGDSGTGKELIARAFAKGKQFYAVNCAEFGKNDEQFLESKLFGRKKGAYTGADSDSVGAFEYASGGVIFLDELHWLSLGSQAKLLRVLQEQKFRRLGDPSGREIELNALVVAATQPLIYDMMDEGTFKQDLFYRIAKQKFHIPTLNERPDDIRPLAEYFFRVYSKMHRRDRAAHPQLLRELEAYSWPANVRELEGCVDSMVMNSTEAVVMPASFALWRAQQKRPTQTTLPSCNLESVKDTVETENIVDALEKSITVAEAATRLQIARTTLNDRMKRLGIQARTYLGRQLGRPMAHA